MDSPRLRIPQTHFYFLGLDLDLDLIPLYFFKKTYSSIKNILEIQHGFFNPLRFNPGKTGIFFTPRKRSTRAKPGFFLPPANVQPGQNRDFFYPLQTFNPGKTGILQTLSKGSRLTLKNRLRVDKSSSGLLLRCNMMQ